MTTVLDKLTKAPPYKLLALDGGGIRGLITLEILARMEDTLRRELERDDDFVLADYFDYVAGTSTGAIIATCLALGWPIRQIRDFYLKSGREMFDRASLLERFRYKFGDANLAALLQAELGRHSTLGDAQLKTLLLLVMRNATTDSPWPISNNPRAKYNARSRSNCNLDLPLWQLVRASTAAPTYFPPETVQVGKDRFIFVDGGVTMYNNPAFQLFLMATMAPYQLCWPVGEQTMLLVSVGTGAAADANANLMPGQMNLVYNATSIPSALMFAASNEQDFLCRAFGRTRCGATLDREVGDLIGVIDPLPEGRVPGPVEPKLFTYMRYNVDLSRAGLTALGLDDIRPDDVQQMDSVDHIEALRRVGAAAAAQVSRAHFANFLHSTSPT
ncbi:MAG: patatin-like phospholipase family protein [Acidobacteriota bacterium]